MDELFPRNALISHYKNTKFTWTAQVTQPNEFWILFTGFFVVSFEHRNYQKKCFTFQLFSFHRRSSESQNLLNSPNKTSFCSFWCETCRSIFFWNSRRIFLPIKPSMSTQRNLYANIEQQLVWNMTWKMNRKTGLEKKSFYFPARWA